MDELVRFFHGGMVKENGEFENMIEDVELFDSSPSFKDLVDRVVSKHSCGIDEITLRGRFDCGKARAHYVMLTLESEMHWRKYKDIVARANVVCWEVVVEITRRSRSQEPVGRVDVVPFRMENITQESTVVEDVPNFTPFCKGMKFNSLPELQFFLADYAVRHHRPFNVVHSDKRVRYDVLCKHGCLSGVWARIVRGTGQ